MPSFPTRVICTLAVVLAVAACGAPAESPPARAPAKTVQEEPPPSTVDEAQEQIRLAREQLFGATAAEPRREVQPGTAAQEPPAEPSARPARPAAPSTDARPEMQDACGKPCRALASMRRAVSALCRMTGDGDERCTSAQRTLKESEARASSCHCG